MYLIQTPPPQGPGLDICTVTSTGLSEAEFTHYLDGQCAKMEWQRIIAQSSTSSVAQYIDFSIAAQTDGDFTRVAPYLQSHSALSRLLHHKELDVLLLKLRVGAGPIRAHTGTFEEEEGHLDLADRLCLRCGMGVVDTLSHAFLHCTHFITVHEQGRHSLASSGSLDQWNQLTEIQQLALSKQHLRYLA